MPLATDSLFQRFGGLEMPLEAADVDTTLAVLDPVRAKLLAFFKAAINSEFGEAWTKITGQLATDHVLRGTSPVQTVLELEPTGKTLSQIKVGFPLLALHRTGEATFESYSFEEERLNQPWDLHYIVAPLEAANVHKIGDICVAVAKLVRLLVRNKSHKSYEDGATQFGDLSRIDVPSFQTGPARYATGDDAPLYLAAVMRLDTQERSGDVDGAFEPLTGIDYDVGVGGPEEGVQPHAILADTDAPLD